MATKKAETKEETKEVKKTAPKLPKLEELYTMKFAGPNGEILMIRKAYGGKPRGRLEIYAPDLKEE